MILGIVRAFAVVLFAVSTVAAQSIPKPSESIGVKIGADRTLADYRQIRTYMKALDTASPRVKVETLGTTTLGEEMIMVVISSAENIRNLDRIKEISKKLADPRGLSSEQIDGLVADGKVVALVTCNIHSTEIASSQMAVEWAHALATATDPETKKRLDDVVLLLVPSLNPDGQIMETEWYRKNVGTPNEGGRLPKLYHHYVGHDNNRDWFMLTQKETRNMSRALYHEWYPQVFVDEHQMGQEGPRMFIPPFADPVDVDVHPLIWREINMIGTNMAFRLEQNEKAGVIYGFQYDAYWIGGTRNTGWWKNITGLLLEVASARMATPVYIDPSELQGGGKGLIEYKAQINHPNPWKGGWWRMRDIMDYERIASDAMLETCSERRADFLRDVSVRARAAVAGFPAGSAYRIPAQQRDPATARQLALLMADHGVEVMEAPDGDFWIPLTQPYSRFVAEMFEPQRYPEIRLTDSPEILRPYDVAAWSLPLLMGVSVERAAFPRDPKMIAVVAPITLASAPTAKPASRITAGHVAVDAGSAQSARVINAALREGGTVTATALPKNDENAAAESKAGTYVIDGVSAQKVAQLAKELRVRLEPTQEPRGTAIKAPRVGIYKPFEASMDEGWTRWLLEQYGFDVKSIENPAMKAGGLSKSFDAIILPSMDREAIVKGRRKTEDGAMKYHEEFPAEFRGGIGETGVAALLSFVENGGTLIAFGQSTEYVTENFNVPVRNAISKLKADEFALPGSLLRAEVSGWHPVTRGMPPEVAIFADRNLAFETSLPGPEMQRWVLMSYPEDSKRILMSGWIRGEAKLARQGAAVAMTYGKGKLVLFGFRPQHRAQTHATFPLLFNALYWSSQ